MYNTGDIGLVHVIFHLDCSLNIFRRWHPDGDLEHLGRIDQQVKIKVRLFL